MKELLGKAIDKVSGLSHALRSYRFGFVCGHGYLSDDHVSLIKQVLDVQDSSKIEEYEHRFSKLIGEGQGVSFASGRMAFYSLLKALHIGFGDEVILPGFTCSVMPNAIWRVGASPVFADINRDNFGSDPIQIERKITEKTKLIVVQHSFGIPCNVHDIVGLGKRYGISIVEDCAIALDSSISGIKVGNWGNAAIFSTDHSKPLNTLIGGFLYTKDRILYEKIRDDCKILPHLDKAHQKRLFQQFMFERKYFRPDRYPFSVIARGATKALKKNRITQKQSVFLDADYVRQPSSDACYPYPAKFPPFLAQLGLYELARWENEKKNRIALLHGYLKAARHSVLGQHLPQAYADPKLEIVPLRFVFEHPQAEMLMKKMDKYIDISWTWFRKPIIGCPDGPESLGYVSGSCQTGEAVGEKIINWPCVLPENWRAKILDIFAEVICDLRERLG